MNTLNDYLSEVYNMSEKSTARSKEEYIAQEEAWIESLDAGEIMEYAEEFLKIVHATYLGKIQVAVKALTGK